MRSRALIGAAIPTRLAVCIAAFSITACSPSTTSITEEWRIGARIRIPGTSPFRLAVGESFIWVLQRGPHGCTKSDPCALSRIDPRTKRVVGSRIPLGDAWDLTTGGGSVWVTQFDGHLIRVDERTGRVEAEIKPGSGYFGQAIAFGGNAIWVARYETPADPASLVKLDPATNRIVGVLEGRTIDARTQTIAFGNEALWLVDHDHFVVKVDPDTLSVEERERPAFGAIGMSVTEEGVFLADPQGKRMAIADPNTGEIYRTATLPFSAIFPVFGGGSLWTTDENAWGTSTDDDRLFRIDPSSLKVAETLHIGGSPAGIAFGRGSVWVALRPGIVVRLEKAVR